MYIVQVKNKHIMLLFTSITYLLEKKKNKLVSID